MGSASVTCLGGSLARPSRGLAALEPAADGAREAGAEVRLLDLRDLDLPFYRPGADPPESALSFADTVYHSGGRIWSSPMYHGTVSGAFTNALDWLQLLADRDPPYLTDKVVGLIGTAGEVQGLQAVNTMEFVVRALRGWAVPLVVPITARQAFGEHEEITDETVKAQLTSLGHQVAEVCLKRRPVAR